MVCVKESYLPKVNTGHISVLADEVVSLMGESKANTFLDCTFGAGGHSRLLLNKFPASQLVAIDQDSDRQKNVSELKEAFPNRLRFYSLNFRDLDKIEEKTFDGILFDFGVSSFQLDQAERGFSFSKDAPLDMRMDAQKGISASEFLNTASEREIVAAVRDYGQEKRWKPVVQAIMKARGTEILETTTSLAQLVYDAVGMKAVRLSKIHPATLTFQGIRIAVNDELNVIHEALPKAFSKLSDGGVLACISFHSLEDRIVKRYFRELCGQPVDRFDNRFADQRDAQAEALSRKPIKASVDEIQKNPRSRSAKLRAIKKKEI